MHTDVQGLVSVVIMATALEVVLLKSSILVCTFCGHEDSMQKIFIKKCFLFMVGSVCSIKQFSLGGKCFADDEVETKVWKQLRQQSKDFYAVGFNALVKRWISVLMLVKDMS
jgi:hypothetical protein